MCRCHFAEYGARAGPIFFLLNVIFGFGAFVVSGVSLAQTMATGTGFFVSGDGLIVTNNHVIQGASSVRARLRTGEILSALILKVDATVDLAVLRVDARSPVLPLLDSTSVRRGQHVFTVGFPHIGIQGLEPKVTDGIISSLAGLQDDPRMFQISVPIQAGNSGGALVDLRGNVVGIVASTLNPDFMYGRSGSLPQNVNFAVKALYLSDFLSRLPAGRPAGLAKANVKDRSFEDVVASVEAATVLVLVERSAPNRLSVERPRLPVPRLPSEPPVRAPAWPQQQTGTLAKIAEIGTITIGYRESSIPFSYLDDKQQPIGYAMDLCMKIVDAVKVELKMPNLKVILQPVTSSNRIPMLQAGNIDVECGSTTNSVERQKQVSFGPTYFVINVTAAVKKNSGIKSLADLNGKTISTTAGTSAIALLKQYASTKWAKIKEIYGKNHTESFLLLAQDRVAAFVMDDILLAGQIANSANPRDYVIINESLRSEPYSTMLRKGDPQFKALIDRTISGLMESGEISQIYGKWFASPIPPTGVNFNFPQTQKTRNAFSSPNDKGI